MVKEEELIDSHETAFIDSFVQSSLRRRFKEIFTKSSIRKSKNRKKRIKWAQLIIEFEHWVDNKCVNTVPLNELTQDRKIEYLKNRGAPELCYVISESKELDGKFLEIDYVLSYLSSNRTYGTILSCIPGKLAYYEHVEHLGLTWILQKR